MKSKKIVKTLVALLIIAGIFIGGVAWGKRSVLKDKVAGVKTEENGSSVVFAPETSKKPNIKLFVMAYCPYGNQAETGLKPVADLLGDKIEIEPHYIFNKQTEEQIRQSCQPYIYSEKTCQGYIDQGYFPNLAACKERMYPTEKDCFDEKSGDCLATSDSYYCSLHGKKELNQGIREVCAWQLTDDKTKWWQFISLVNSDCPLEKADQCWQDQAEKTGLDQDKIQECFNTKAVEIMDKEIALSTKFKAQGSPTIFINDLPYPPEGAYQAKDSSMRIDKNTFTPDQYRLPEVFKQAICTAFKKPPKQCKTKLSMESNADAGSCN